nr:hypothetical protein [Sphingomonas sp. SRS2]
MSEHKADDPVRMHDARSKFPPAAYPIAPLDWICLARGICYDRRKDIGKSPAPCFLEGLFGKMTQQPIVHSDEGRHPGRRGARLADWDSGKGIFIGGSAQTTIFFGDQKVEIATSAKRGYYLIRRAAHFFARARMLADQRLKSDHPLPNDVWRQFCQLRARKPVIPGRITGLNDACRQFAWHIVPSDFSTAWVYYAATSA